MNCQILTYVPVFISLTHLQYYFLAYLYNFLILCCIGQHILFKLSGKSSDSLPSIEQKKYSNNVYGPPVTNSLAK